MSATEASDSAIDKFDEVLDREKELPGDLGAVLKYMGEIAPSLHLQAEDQAEEDYFYPH